MTEDQGPMLREQGRQSALMKNPHLSRVDCTLTRKGQVVKKVLVN